MTGLDSLCLARSDEVRIDNRMLQLARRALAGLARNRHQTPRHDVVIATKYEAVPAAAVLQMVKFATVATELRIARLICWQRILSDLPHHDVFINVLWHL